MPKFKAQVRIVSDGTPWGTEIYVNDTLLTCATKVSWELAYGDLATATLVINGVALEATSELGNVEFEEAKT